MAKMISKCAINNGLGTCAECADYGCELVSGIWDHDPSIKANLDKLRA